ncbi:MAG TPA: hypothetical protein VFD36_01190 [Kofleriaceae bacterium]|nr:hypothetical protein [Kofleriaceae bacterium]
MRVSEQPDTVIVVAGPPTGTMGATDNAFIDDVLKTLSRRTASGTRVLRACSVRDIDVELGKLLGDDFKGEIRLQIVGHSISGMLSLGASWIPESEMLGKAFRYPHYVLDTNPAALGLLAKYVEKISEVMLVGCNIGSASSFGYAINGRTLTYTLAEMLRCLVRGADDVVAPDEFDSRGWYAPSAQHRRPKGWRWLDGRPPVWTDPGLDPVQGRPASPTQTFEIRALTSSLLPMTSTEQPIDLGSGLRITCKYVAPDKPRSALPDVSIETDRGPAELLCGGRFLKWLDTYYVVEHSQQLSAALTARLWRVRATSPVTLANVAG